MKKAEEAIPTAVFDTEKSDEEMQAEYGMSAPQHKPAFLYVERGPGAGQLLEVKQGSLVIGRASISDLRLQHPSISRRHCQIKRVGESFFVKDLGSQNGTFVNKQRIATEVEVKVGDHIALGNALVRLRGPMLKGEKLPSAKPQPHSPEKAEAKTMQAEKLRISTAVVARPSGPFAVQSNALKIAVFAGAVGFGLAAVLAIALIKTMSTGQSAAAEKKPAATAKATSDREKVIQDAIARKMQERKVEEPPAPEEPAVEAGAVVVRQDPKQEPPSVTRVAAPPRPSAARVAVARKAAPAKAAEASDDEDSTPAAKGPGGKRLQILAPYEKGNAEGSLELAKKAGDKELSDKLMRFIQLYDAANDAMMANNGIAAIANFQKALKLDEELSSGWGKYGAEMRKQLANLYVLVGMQFASNGDDEKAKQAFQAALKHDPSNSRAKGQLEKLTGSSGAKSPDEAFEGGAEKPEKKAAPKSIDDAFGD